MAVPDALRGVVGTVVGYVFGLVALAHPTAAATPHGFDHILSAHLWVNTMKFTKRLNDEAGWHRIGGCLEAVRLPSDSPA